MIPGRRARPTHGLYWTWKEKSCARSALINQRAPGRKHVGGDDDEDEWAGVMQRRVNQDILGKKGSGQVKLGHSAWTESS